MIKTKISANFIFTKLFCLVASGFCLFKYFEAKKIDDLYTEAWFLAIIFFLLAFVYFYNRPKVYFDNFNFYFRKNKKNEMVVPLASIQSIFRNTFSKLALQYEIEYLDEDNEIEKITFYSDSWDLMEDFQERVIKINPSVEIV